MRYDKTFRESGYHTALLTTFSFDPSVFENVLLVALRNHGSRNIAVLADRDMLNNTFGEVKLAGRAGSAYHLAKRKVSGAFHPKIVLQLGDREGRLMIGSANLTGAGLIGNLEAVSTLTVTAEDQRAAPLFAAALEYFVSHTDPKDPAMSRVIARARRQSPWIASLSPKREVEIDGSRIALLFEREDASVGDAMTAFIGEDRISRLIAVSPFWDADLRGLSRLREAMGRPETSIIVDPREQDFDATALSTLGNGVTLHSAALHAGATPRDANTVPRPLHAKIIIACGEAADYVLSGSANVSSAGLFSRAGGAGNAEAGLLRTEPPGTAIERLLLDPCLAVEMPADDLRPRRRQIAIAGEDAPQLTDGGALFFERGELTWIPPTGRPPQGSQIIFQAKGAALDAGREPSFISGAWRVVLGSEIDTPRHAFIRFADGAVSAPVPVSALGRLDYNARTPPGAGPKHILSQIGDLYEVDLEMLNLFLKLQKMRQDNPGRKREGRTSDQDMEDEPKTPGPMSAEDFGLLVEDAGSDGAEFRQGALADVRRIINAKIGIISSFEDEADDDPLSDLIKPEGSGGKPPPSGGGRHRQQAWSSAPQEPGTMEQAAKRVKSLYEHVDRSCEALMKPKIDPLSAVNALGLRLLVMSILRNACLIGDDPSPEHPIPAASRQGEGWIRLIGRLLDRLHFATKGYKKREEQMDEERLEALALLLFAAGTILEAAREATPKVAARLQAINAHLAKTTSSLIADDSIAAAYLERVIAQHDKAYARFSQACSRNEQNAQQT